MINVYKWELYREMIRLWTTPTSKFRIRYSDIEDKENCHLVILDWKLEKHIVYSGGIDHFKLFWVLNKYNIPWSTTGNYGIYYLYNNKIPIMCDI